ncbi:MAG: hypothetical protein ACMXX9_02620 [Candidatus Woesearchaeota archaeon]
MNFLEDSFKDLIEKYKPNNNYDFVFLDNPGYLSELAIEITNKSHIEFELYSDSNNGVCLTYNNRPNAVMGLEIVDDVLMMTQLQGINGYDFWNKKKIHPAGLQDIRWRELFLEVKYDLAKALKKEFVGIISADNLEFKTTTIKKNYDLLALNNSYNQLCDYNWMKKI